MINQFSLSQLEHKAICEDNELALAILDCIEDEVLEAVEAATQKNDADYSYGVFDAVNAVECLINANWYKVEETRKTKDRIIYMIDGLHEDTSPYNNQVVIFKYKGSDLWYLNAAGGEHGEQVESTKFKAVGFKEAQQLATKQIIKMIKEGFELNFGGKTK